MVIGVKEACGGHDNGGCAKMRRVLPSTLVYSTQRLHIIPEEEIPKKTEKRNGGI